MQLQAYPWAVVVPGAGEDVEAVLARLQAQAAENALLKERQAKSSSDLQVSSHLTPQLLTVPPHQGWLTQGLQVQHFCMHAKGSATVHYDQKCASLQVSAHSNDVEWAHAGCGGHELHACWYAQHVMIVIELCNLTKLNKSPQHMLQYTVLLTGSGGEVAAGAGPTQQAAVCL